MRIGAQQGALRQYLAQNGPGAPSRGEAAGAKALIARHSGSQRERLVVNSRFETANANLDNDERSPFQRRVEIRRRLYFAGATGRKELRGSSNRFEAVLTAPI